VVRHVVVLNDDRHVYMFRLDTFLDALDPAFVAALVRAVRSTRPVPRSHAARADRSVLEHWV
jgi:hypothetical protein